MAARRRPAQPEVPTTLAEAAQLDDDLTMLKLLRNKLAAQLDALDKPSAVWMLAARLVEVQQRIADLAPNKKDSIVDQLAARRSERLAASRRSDASDSGSAASAE